MTKTDDSASLISPEVRHIIETEFKRSQAERARAAEASRRADAVYLHWHGLMSVHGLLTAESADASDPLYWTPSLYTVKTRPIDTVARMSKPDNSGRTGITTVIKDVVARHPGLPIKE